MTNDIATIGPIVRLASGKTIGDELAFTFPEVLEVVDQCSTNDIAVLGVEVFEHRPTGYMTKSLSTYDLEVGPLPTKYVEWANYIARNNSLAAEFIKLHPSGDAHFYVLTACSWKEFCALKGLRP